MSDNKPCPFCGSHTIKMSGGYSGKADGDIFWVRCKSCQTEGPVGDDEDVAWDAWNRRGSEGTLR